MIDLSNFKSLSINGRALKSLSFNGNIIWRENTGPTPSPDEWFTWTDDGTTATVTGLTTLGNQQHEFVIPTKHNNLSVKTIGNNAFQNNLNIQKITGESIETIGTYVFNGCSSLTTALFPVCTSIGSDAFNRCSLLAEISFPVCTSIGGNAFYYCTSLITASFPTCTSIGDRVFYNCTSLITASFPTCTSIGNYTFNKCSYLAEVNLSNSTMSQVKAMTNFPWTIINASCQIICSNGWVDKNGTEHPNT